MPSRSRIEQETTVCFNQAEDDALIWTCSPAHQRKFARMGYKCVGVNGEGKMFTVPKKAISFRKVAVSSIQLKRRGPDGTLGGVGDENA